jgi:basic amino acid/polyamine antiporter, APA family
VYGSESLRLGNTIAAGIVAAQGHIAALLPNIWLFLGVSALGGNLYALLGASSLAELSTAIPRSGGQYNYSRRALREYAGFVVGWSDWLSMCGTNAVVALVIGNYSGVLFPVLAGHDAIIAVAVLFAFALLQWRGIKWGSAHFVGQLYQRAPAVCKPRALCDEHRRIVLQALHRG